MKRKNKCLALLLCVSLLFSMSAPAAQPVRAAASVRVLLDGQETTAVTIDRTGKVALTATTGGMTAPTFQWQILYDVQNSAWVNIYDRTESTCEVSYALVKHMLDAAQGAYVRCAATGDGEKVYSDAISVTVLAEPSTTLQAAALTPAVDESLSGAVAVSADPQVPAALSSARGAEEEYVTITIKYLDMSSLTGGGEAAIYSPYTATIEKGTGFHQSVVSPTFLGFAPFLDSNGDRVIDADDQSADIYVFDLDSVTDNVEIKVYYKAIKVNFAVKYFFQNINDDLYTEAASRYHTGQAETGTIISNDYLMEHAGDTTGFTKMYHIPESIAADGSTVFECYYDRNYYLIQFDLNGGYGVEPIYARYDTPFIVNDPIRHGYTFDGWKLIGVDTNDNGECDDDLPTDISTELVSTIPAHSYRYQAQWKTVNTTYTAVYWLDGNYVTGKVLSAQSGSYVSGKDDLDKSALPDIDEKYYTFDRADQNVLVEGDGSTVVNVYYQSKEYTLRFYYAATTGEGRDEDGDGVAETYDSVKIVGGSTYFFGKTSSYNTSDDKTLLDHNFSVYSGSLVGTVTTLPMLNAEGQSRPYTHGVLTSGATSYHYIEFTAKYGQDISRLWPCAVFESATRTDASNNQNQWEGDQAFVSAWNGEHHVRYSQEHENQTIKGKYEKLDSMLLFDSSFADESTVSYLCFWENGAATVSWNVPKLFVYNIWVPVLAGESTAGLTTKERGGITYKLIDSYDTCDNSNAEQQTEPALGGYRCVDKDSGAATFDPSLYKEGYAVNFYYTQETNTFAMKSRGEPLVDLEVGAGEGVPFGTTLSSLAAVQNAVGDGFAPPYPSTLEENAYYFDGWYTTELCLPDTKFDLATAKMPASGLILYANWVPKTHTVRFFATHEDMLAFESNLSTATHHVAAVKHGDTVGVVDTPVRTGSGELSLVFAGWFYIENGQKKAFSTLNMPVGRDIHIFAEWSSHSPQPYHLSYVLRNDPATKVADDTTGFAYGGSTRTFNAKAGDPYNQLYTAYNHGYFPTVSSHSITIQAEADKNHPEHNVYTFYYVYATNISYTVRYVNRETNVVMATETRTTQSAVVTERFKTFTDMVPDAFYKRLILEVEENESGEWVGTQNNVITFYYTPNKTNAYYAVHFMLEKLDATDADRANYDISGKGGYEETATHIEGIGKIGSTVYIAPQTISGFTLIEDTNVPIELADGTARVPTYSDTGGGYGITITQDGTELYFFYRRNPYPYQVYYYEYNTTIERASTVTRSAPFGSSVSESAIPIAGYTCVSELTKTITIREDDGTQKLNVILFYYAPLQYVAEYVPVPDDGGRLSNTIEVITGSQALTGSKPTANPYYEFDGWYTDAACTQPVTAAQGAVTADGYFTPDKSKLSETQRNLFYAKFNKKVGDLTIVRSNAADADQVFVYEITSHDTHEVFYVTVTGNGSVTIRNLPLGQYTVTQQNDWSWRYADVSKTAVSHLDAHGTTVLFSQTQQKAQWLNGNSDVITNQKG